MFDSIRITAHEAVQKAMGSEWAELDAIEKAVGNEKYKIPMLEIKRSKLVLALKDKLVETSKEVEGKDEKKDLFNFFWETVGELASPFDFAHANVFDILGTPLPKTQPS